MWLGNTFCPKYSDIRPLPCPKPPPKSVLIDQVNEAIVKRFGDNAKCLATTSYRSPTVRWLLEILAVLDPSHVNFVKGYSHEKAPIVGESLRLKVEYIRGLGDMNHPVFTSLPLCLVVRRKSLKSMAFTGLQPQVCSHLHPDSYAFFIL